MAIVRGKHSSNYTILSNKLINDPALNWDALGLLTYLISKPEHWQVNIKDLSKRGYARAKIYRLLKQIRDAGYASYTRRKDGRTDWVIYDMPRDQIDNEGQKPRDLNDHMAQIKLDRADTRDQQKKPRDQIDHVLESNDLKESNDLLAQFMRFWDMYGKKVGKVKTQKKFLKLSQKTRNAIFEHVPKYVKAKPDKQFRKDPLTYLNSEIWLDEEIVSSQQESMDVGADW